MSFSPAGRPPPSTHAAVLLAASLGIVALLLLPVSGLTGATGLSPPAAPTAVAVPDGAAEVAAAEATLRPLPATGPPSPWTNLTPNLTNAPSPRDGAAITFDGADNYVLLFGGLSDLGVMHDTWKFSAGVWTNLTANLSVSPPPRYNAVLVSDSKDTYVVLFGGRASTYRNDTWKWSGGAWTQLSPATAPSPREQAMATYDRSDAYVLLFGGQESNGALENDTWSFSGGAWSNLSGTLSVAPPVRAAGGMTFDSADSYVLLFGGKHGVSAVLRDTWSFTAGAWTNVTPVLKASPTARESPMFSDDSVDGFVLMFGGLHLPNTLADEWEYAHAAWTQLNTTTPSAREGGALVYNHNNGFGYVLLFGGVTGLSNGTELGDSWSFKLPLYSNLSASPSPSVDVGRPLVLSLNVTGGYGFPTYTVGWLTLPAGCAGGDVVTITCSPTTVGTVGVSAWAVDLQGTNVTSNLLNVTVVTPPNVSASVEPLSGAAPLTITYEANASGGAGGYNFTWNFDDGTLGYGAPGSHTFETDGTFVVTVNVRDSAGGTSAATAATVVVTPKLNVIATASPPSGVAPLPVSFSAQVSGGVGPYSYLWGFGTGSQSSAASNPSFTYTLPGTYQASVSVTDHTGSTVSAVAPVTVANEPTLTAAAHADPTSGAAPLPVQFTGAAAGGSSAYSYGWTFDSGGATSTLQDPSFAYTAVGTYVAILTVTDTASHSAQATVTVTVSPGSANLSVNFTAVVGSSYCDAGSPVAPVNLSATAAGGSGGYTYAWTYLGGSPTGAHTTALLGAGTTGEVSLLVNDSTGHTATATQNVTTAPLSCSTTPATTTSSDHPLLYVVLAVLIVVIAAELLLVLRGRKKPAPPPPRT